MTKRASERKGNRPIDSATILRAYRLDARLSRSFEEDCTRHLRNPKMVIEALLDHWLRADSKTQAAIAERYSREKRTYH